MHVIRDHLGLNGQPPNPTRDEFAELPPLQPIHSLMDIPLEGPPQPGQVIFITPDSPPHRTPDEDGDRQDLPTYLPPGWASTDMWWDLNDPMAWAGGDSDSDSEEDPEEDNFIQYDEFRENQDGDRDDHNPGNYGLAY